MAGKRLSDAIEEYLRIQQARAGTGGHRGSNTAAADNNVLSMFLRMSGDRVLTNLTPEHVEAWFYGPGGIRDHHEVKSKRLGQGGMAPPVAEATHNHYRSRLKMFFKWCTNRGYMRVDVMAHTQALKVPRMTRQRPSAVTLLALLDATTNGRDRAYLATAMNTALRSSDIHALRVGDVDLAGGWIHAQIRKTRDADSKPISEDLDAELRAWLTEYGTALGRPLTEHDYLFPRRRGGLISHYEDGPEGVRVPVRAPYTWVPDQPLGDTHLIVQKALKALGLPTHKEGTHTVRRAVARAYFDWVAAEKGDQAALRETASFLNHSSTATTELYLGMTPEKERRDRRLRGNAFLTSMVAADNVVPLRPVNQGE
jgi:integrase